MAVKRLPELWTLSLYTKQEAQKRVLLLTGLLLFIREGIFSLSHQNILLYITTSLSSVMGVSLKIKGVDSH